MTRHFFALACAGFLLVACGGSKPSTTTTGPDKTAACEPTDCGAEPPISPSVCPEGEAVSTVCERATSGTCERRILCNGKAPEAAAEVPAAQP